MKLIDEKEVEEVSKSDRWFESIGTPSSDYQLGFVIGSNWTQQKLQPMMVELIDWIDENEWNNNVTSREKLEQFLKNKQK